MCAEMRDKMDNENNKISLEKNGNETSDNENAGLYTGAGNPNQENLNQSANPYGNSQNSNQNNFGGMGNQNDSWNNAGYQNVNGQQSSNSTFSPSGFAIASLVLGILSIVCCCAWYISGIFAILGIVFSIIVLTKNKPGRGMAIAGLVCSAIGIIIAVVMLVMVLAVGTSFSTDDYKKIIDNLNSME